MELVLAIGSACWLGLLTSISPCPLAANIAAISYTSRKVSSVARVLGAGLLYTLGRTVAYVALGALLVQGAMAAPALSHFLQKYMNLFLGPLLILVGMVLLDLLRFKPGVGTGVGAALQARIENAGVWGAFVLGVILALTLCPVSAAIFFGSLLPIAIDFESGFLLPAVYGAATGVPVLVFALLLAFCTNKVARAYDRLAKFEFWAQRVTGILFLIIGIFMTLTLSLGVKVG